MRAPRRLSILVALVAILVPAGSVSAGAVGGTKASIGRGAGPVAGRPDLGPNVRIIDPSMSTAEIQSIVDGIASQQIPSQFGSGRYALLFEPGTYATANQPLNFQVGYYTDVAGLGR